MKAANINAVRTSHYNHAAHFLELCEEKGLYVLDEVPGCWSGTSIIPLKDAFLRAAQRNPQRDKNRPCVLAWTHGQRERLRPRQSRGV